MRRQSFESLDGLMRNNSVSNKSADNIYYIIAEPYSEDLGASGWGWILHSQLTGKPINSVPMSASEKYTPSEFKEVFGISADDFMKNVDKIIIYFTGGEEGYTNIKSIPKDGFVSLTVNYEGMDVSIDLAIFSRTHISGFMDRLFSFDIKVGSLTHPLEESPRIIFEMTMADYNP